MHKLPLARTTAAATLTCVNKLCIFAGTTILGYAGWYAGVLLGLEFFGCFMVSGLGSVIGVWAGWKVAQKLG